MSTTKRCGYTLFDSEGEQYPCDRPAFSWRWYQNVEHEDLLDEACELHENEGGRRIAHQAEQIAAVLALHVTSFDPDQGRDFCDNCDHARPCPTVRALGVEA